MQQINAIFAKAIRVPSQERIEFFSKHFDKLYANHTNLQEFYGQSTKSGKQPDHLGDIGLLVSIFRDKLGSTWDEIQAPSETSELLGAGIKRERVAHHLMWKTRETDLPKWVDKVIADGSLWRDPEKTQAGEAAALALPDGSDEEDEGGHHYLLLLIIIIIIPLLPPPSPLLLLLRLLRLPPQRRRRPPPPPPHY